MATPGEPSVASGASAAEGHRPLRIALLAYRGDPFCGGQGIYVRHLSRELVALGHQVEVFAGPPYPRLDPGVALTPLPSLDLYRQPDPFRRPRLHEFHSPVDVLEFALMCSAGFPEPLTFSLRAASALRARGAEFDVVHDNQSLGYGLLDIARRMPLLATIHHPIDVDRRIELDAADGWRRLSLRRWYGFTRMQGRVARRVPRVLTVSASSADDIVRELGVRRSRLEIIGVGIDPRTFRPLQGLSEVRGRIVTTASADVPLKGLTVLLEATAKLAVERDVELVVVGKRKHGGTTEATIERLGLGERVRFVSGISDAELVELLNTAQVAVVPSLYEGFSLPAIEALACGKPLVATTGGALPEVVGDTGVLVPPGDVERLQAAIAGLLDDRQARRERGRAGRERVLAHFTWTATAARTAELYRKVIADAHR